MGNLGKYQEIVTAAKRAGGVENLIKVIEDDAVAKAGPKIFARGAGAGALGVLGAVTGIRRYSQWKAERTHRALLAKAQLRAEVEDAMDADAGHAEDLQATLGGEGGDQQ